MRSVQEGVSTARSVGLALLGLLASCTARDEAPPREPGFAWWEGERLDPPESETTWRTGDDAVYRVRFEDQGEERSWRIQVTNLHPPDVGPVSRTISYDLTW